MKQHYVTSLFLFICAFIINAQELYVGDGAEFFVGKNMEFTTSNTIVTLGSTGIFSLENGSEWGSPQEYVAGKVVVYGNGETKIPIGDNNIYTPISIDHSTDVSAQYFNQPPSSGTAGADVDATSTEEYWQITGHGVVTLPWNLHSDITLLVNNNGGKLDALAIVGLEGSVWNLVSDPITNTVTGDLSQGTVTSDPNTEIDLDNFSQITFGIDHQALLAVDDLFVTNNIIIMPNPISKDSEYIEFTADNISGLEITMFDVLGRTIHRYNDVAVASGIGTISKPNVIGGLYFLKFSYHGKSGVRKILIE